MIKSVLFDMDGLMFDTESMYSVVQDRMSRKRGKNFTLEVKNTLMGKRAHEVAGLLNSYWGKEEEVEYILSEQDEELVRLYKTEVEKLPGLDNLLKFLNKQKIRKCIGTSSRMFLVDILLDRHDLKDEFEFVVSGDMVNKGKPDPEIYDMCIDKLSLDPKDCLVLEDSLNGVRAGNAAGCMTCAIPSEFTQHENFSPASLVVKQLDDNQIKELCQKR